MVRNENRVLIGDDSENEYETEEKDKTAFENFMQGINNIDTAMEAMIDNYTDGMEHLGEQNGFQDGGGSIFDKHDAIRDV